MTAPTDDQLAERIAALLDQALSSIKRDDTGARVFPIDDAAARLNMSARTLELWCRTGSIDHTKIGKFRGLTAEQIDRVAADHEVKSGRTAPVRIDDGQAARLASLKAAGRKTRRPAA